MGVYERAVTARIIDRRTRSAETACRVWCGPWKVRVRMSGPKPASSRGVAIAGFMQRPSTQVTTETAMSEAARLETICRKSLSSDGSSRFESSTLCAERSESRLTSPCTASRWLMPSWRMQYSQRSRRIERPRWLRIAATMPPVPGRVSARLAMAHTAIRRIS